MLERLAPAWPTLENLSRVFLVELSCVVYIYGNDRPALGFDCHEVRQIASLHAAIDIDLYVLPRRRKPTRVDNSFDATDRASSTAR